jgi:hypothetical protein
MFLQTFKGTESGPPQEEHFPQDERLGPHSQPQGHLNSTQELQRRYYGIYDIPHSEWKVLGENLQELLTSVLTPDGLLDYVSAFLHFPVPEHWTRIQNPKTHVGSWSLSEHGLAAHLYNLVSSHSSDLHDFLRRFNLGFL